MTDGLLEQRLHHLLSQYGQVETMQHFPHAQDGATIILATMKTAEEAIAAQHALGLSLFGFNSLIINEDWVKDRWQENASRYSAHMSAEKTVTVCTNFRTNPDTPSCAARGGTEIATALQTAIAERGLPVAVETFHCLGMCDRGPNIKLSPGGEFWHAVQPGQLSELLDRIAAFAQE